MIFHLHFILITSGLSSAALLLGVFIQTYTDASKREIAVLLMSMPFISMIIKPLFCSVADRHQSHRLVLIFALSTMMIGYSPFIVIPTLKLNPRAAWYLIIIASLVGSGGLEVARALGDSLAINYARKTKTSYGKMRLAGTLSWGIFGFIIGQINELQGFPKYVPGFLVLQTSILVEILLLIYWNREDFIMSDPLTEEQPPSRKSLNQISIKQADSATDAIKNSCIIEQSTNSANKNFGSNIKTTDTNMVEEQVMTAENEKIKDKGVQILLFKMILIHDGRLAKYLIVFVIFGILVAPTNFVFLNMSELCESKGYSFSQLAGSITIVQSLVEATCFVFVPWISDRMSRTPLITFAWALMTARYFFYASLLSNTGISPYWSILSECALGMAYAIFCTYLAFLSFMFANQSRLFVPELSKLGYLSSGCGREVGNDENFIKMALRATMQGTFHGALGGLGKGLGALISSLIVEPHSFTKLWQFLTLISIATLLIHLLIEVVGCEWSDRYKPEEGTQAYACRQNFKDK